MSLQKGLRGSACITVGEGDTAVAQGSGTVPVFATPRLVAVMEAAAVAALNGVLPQGQTSVGTKVDVEHLAATPVGMEVVAVAELTEVDGRRLVFAVEARDPAEVVGRGRHERFLIDEARFLAKVAQKNMESRGVRGER
ncbi:MAG: hotdog domain-containing protein [Bacillota bacterium]